jgi:hypothetical protein
LVVGEFGFRIYWVNVRATYGPFVVTIDAPGDVLSDVVVQLRCNSAPNELVVHFVTRTREPVEVPARYLPQVQQPFPCEVLVSHPHLGGYSTTDLTVDHIQPRTRVLLPTVQVALWNPQRIRRLLTGDERLPGRPDENPIFAARDALDDEVAALATLWLPQFCGSALPRVQDAYVPRLALERTHLLLSDSLIEPDPTFVANINERWDSACQFYCDADARRAGNLPLARCE